MTDQELQEAVWPARAANHPNPRATHPHAPLFVAETRNGSTFVYEYKPNQHDHGTYGHAIGPLPRKRAQEVAAALNRVFDLGLTQGAM